MKRQRGPGQGERLKIEGDWQSAVRKLAKAPKPPPPKRPTKKKKKKGPT